MKSKNIIVKALPVLLLLLVLILAGCKSAATPTVEPIVEEATEIVVVAPTEIPTEEPTAEPAATPIVLVDGAGREVTLAEPAQRIVSLAPSNVEILFAIGAGEQVVGRDDNSDYPEDALEITSIGSTWGALNTEAIVELEPDLVLAAGINTPEQVQAIEDLEITVFVIGNPADFEGMYDNLETVGILTDHQDDAEVLVEGLAERVDALTEKMADAEPVKIYFEVDATDPNAPWTAGTGTFQDYIITLSGGENVASDIENWGQISLEDLVERDPEVMIFGHAPYVPTTVESVGERPGWASIAAVANGKVYSLETNWIDRPSCSNSE
jgi:iron complex transport system substrate-binding protein